MAGLNFTVTEAQTRGFANCWDSGGIKVILDSTTVRFATDYANIVLKSFVADMQAQVKKVAEAKLAAQKAPPAKMQGDITVEQIVPTQAPKSSIVLTDRHAGL